MHVVAVEGVFRGKAAQGEEAKKLLKMYSVIAD